METPVAERPTEPLQLSRADISLRFGAKTGRTDKTRENVGIRVM